jgi:hypothetical protein
METKETKVTVEKTVTGHTPLTTETHTHTEVKEERKYSKGTEGAQRLGRGLNNAATDVANAVSAALETYRDRADKSSKEKKDGMVRDAVENLAKAAGEGLKKAADAPYDLVKTVTRGKSGKQVRKVIKVFAPPMFR